MIKIDYNNYNMEISAKDTFSLTFTIQGYTLLATDTVTFAIKSDLVNGSTIWSLTGTNFTGDTFTLDDTSNTFATVTAGKYYYDISITSVSGDKATINFPCKFEVKAITHA